MSKGKLQKFAEYDSFSNTFNPGADTAGKWSEIFGNTNPIVLELACGKADYALGLARLFPEKNFIGIDIKGSRLWKGAKTALEENLTNVRLLRTEIHLLENYFHTNEFSEIWITFADPQPSKKRKRLTHPNFLNLYHRLHPAPLTIHLKTDSDLLYEFTKEVVAQNNLSLIEDVPNVYAIHPVPPVLNIQTFYENIWLKEGRTIKYFTFELNKSTTYTEEK